MTTTPKGPYSQFTYLNHDTAISDPEGFTTPAEEAATLTLQGHPAETQIQRETRGTLKRAATAKPISPAYKRTLDNTN